MLTSESSSTVSFNSILVLSGSKILKGIEVLTNPKEDMVTIPSFRFTGTLSENSPSLFVTVDKLVPFTFKYADGIILDRKSTRLNSSHVKISYAVFCLTQQTANA